MTEYIGWLDDEWNTVLDHNQPVVRCRDCKYCDEERSLCCKWFDWIPVEPDGFCAWGERTEQ